MSPLHRIVVSLLLASGLAATTRAAGATPPVRVVSETVAARLGELRTLADAHNYAAALALAERLLVPAKTDSYDAFVLSQVRAQILIAENRPADALAPLAASLRLADAQPFLDAKPRLDLVYLLAQVCAQVAAEATDPAVQRTRFAEARAYVRRWLDETPAPTATAHHFAASVLYNEAQGAMPAPGPVAGREPDAAPAHAQFAAALAEAEQAFALSVRPDEQLLVLILACHQQLGDFVRAAEVLEQLVGAHPTNAVYWQQLAATYLNLAATDTGDPRPVRRRLGEIADARHDQLRAVLSIERAQEAGFLRAPSDHFNLARLYFNLGQPVQAAARLDNNLAGPLGDDRRAWELLVRARQESHDTIRALATLEQAVARFPSDQTFARALASLRPPAGAVEETRPPGH